MHRRWLAAAVLLVVVSALALDLRRPATDQWSAQAALLFVGVHRSTLGRWAEASGVRCRFHPTCSHYAEATIRRYGTAQGGWLAMKRVMRCGPWTPHGTVDWPPQAAIRHQESGIRGQGSGVGSAERQVAT